MSLSRPLRKMKARITDEDEDEDEEDRISRLPDELIHQILWFVDTKLAVQTSLLSKRWKLIWKTLPFLKFKWDQQGSPTNTTNFTRKVLNRRNHQSQISNLELAFLPAGLFTKFVEYAISHHVQYLNVHLRHDHKPHKLSSFSSKSIQKLQLEMKFEDSISELDCWDLPALKTLHLTSYYNKHVLGNLSELCLTCLPALRTLCLEYFDLQSVSISLSALTTLRLFTCKLPKIVWDFPSLKSLTLHDVVFPKDMSYLFAALVTLQDLTLLYEKESIQDCVIPSPQLVNLEIKSRYRSYTYRIMGNIVVVAPKLRSFTSVGIFQITFGVSKLENVNIRLRDCIDHMSYPLEKLNEYYQQLTFMLPGVASAKILNLDLETLQALSSIEDLLEISPSPFYNLKYVKLPHGFKGFEEKHISDILRRYLLGGSPTATIVTTSPQNMIPPTAAASVTARNVVLQEPLVASTKVLLGSKNICKNVCVDNVDMGEQEGPVVQNSAVNADKVDMGVQEEYVVQNSAANADNKVDMGVQEESVVQNSAVNADRVKQIGAPVEGTGNGRVSSSRGDSDFGLWRGHEVNSEFVCLLDNIMNKYPETFEHFNTKNRKFCTLKLNMLCSSVNDFTKISVTDVNTEMIGEYRDVFSELQKLDFDVSWLVSHLNYMEKLRLSHPLLHEPHVIDCFIDNAKSKLHDSQIHTDDTKTKLQDLQTLREEKMQEIQKAFGTMGTNIIVGCIGDDLLSGP